MAETGCDASSRRHVAADTHDVGFERVAIVCGGRMVSSGVRVGSEMYHKSGECVQDQPATRDFSSDSM